MRRTKGTGPTPQKLYLTARAKARLEAATVGTPHNMSSIVDDLIMRHLPMTADEKRESDKDLWAPPDPFREVGKRPGTQPSKEEYKFNG